MKTAEIRQKLIEEINLSNNISLLAEMYNFLNRDNDADLYKLSKTQQDAIAEGRDQIRNGQFVSNDQVNEEIDQWLKGK